MRVQRAAARSRCTGTAYVTPRHRAPAPCCGASRACHASITHPVNSQTSEPVASTAGPRRSGSRADAADRVGARWSRWATREHRRSGQQQRWRGSIENAQPLPTRRDALLSRRAPRACPSIRRPNGTPLGQAGSQPRHCTHVSMISTKSSSIGAPRHCTARIASIRPAANAPPRRWRGTSDSAAGTARTPRTY